MQKIDMKFTNDEFLKKSSPTSRRANRNKLFQMYGKHNVRIINMASIALEKSEFFREILFLLFVLFFIIVVLWLFRVRTGHGKPGKSRNFLIFGP